MNEKNQNQTPTPEELDALREYRNYMQRKWWSKMTPEERRERRQRYALNMMRNKIKAAEEQQSRRKSNG